MEVDGQDPIGAARPFLHPLPGVVGWEQWVLPASLPHHAYKAHLLVSLFALASWTMDAVCIVFQAFSQAERQPFALTFMPEVMEVFPPCS